MVFRFILYTNNKGGLIMVSYHKLRRYLFEKKITHAQCRKDCHISPNTWTKINKDEYVNLEIINRICAKYKLEYGEILEYRKPDKKKGEVD